MSGRVSRLALSALLCAVAATGCGVADVEEEDRSHEGPITASGTSYAVELVSFSPGAGAGFGQQALPDVVLGAPQGGGERQGSLDVLSLGVGGEIVLGFGERELVDGEGIDLVVFENAFFYGSEADPKVFTEYGEVAVSEDGERWVVFPCEAMSGEGCAGRTPTREFDVESSSLMASEVGGDGFDLARVGVKRARYVRIRDRAEGGGGPSAGFDLDAVLGLNVR